LKYMKTPSDLLYENNGRNEDVMQYTKQERSNITSPAKIISASSSNPQS